MESGLFTYDTVKLVISQQVLFFLTTRENSQINSIPNPSDEPKAKHKPLVAVDLTQYPNRIVDVFLKESQRCRPLYWHSQASPGTLSYLGRV